MASEESFLCAIHDEPDDDALRLVFADWLADQGDPRSEIVRQSVELAQLPEWHPRRVEGEHELNETVRRDSSRWLGPLANRVKSCSLERGLLRVDGPLSRLAGALARKEAARVVRWIAMLTPDGYYGLSVEELLKLPAMQHLPGL